jgi:hypothetical protein
MWVAIHMCMEAMLGISLHSYPYLKLAKTLCLSYSLLYFLFNKIGEQEGGTGSAWEDWGMGRDWGSGPSNVYTLFSEIFLYALGLFHSCGQIPGERRSLGDPVSTSFSHSLSPSQ